MLMHKAVRQTVHNHRAAQVIGKSMRIPSFLENAKKDVELFRTWVKQLQNVMEQKPAWRGITDFISHLKRQQTEITEIAFKKIKADIEVEDETTQV